MKHSRSMPTWSDRDGSKLNLSKNDSTVASIFLQRTFEDKKPVLCAQIAICAERTSNLDNLSRGATLVLSPIVYCSPLTGFQRLLEYQFSHGYGGVRTSTFAEATLSRGRLRPNPSGFEAEGTKITGLYLKLTLPLGQFLVNSGEKKAGNG
jgi:hypothetical protein